MRSQFRAALWLVYAVYLGWVAYLVWTPSPSLPGDTIARILEASSRLGVVVTADQIELLLNIVMLVPLSLIGGLLFRRLRIADWTALGFVASLLIEVVQRLALPTRAGSSRDVVANTLGSLLGALILSVGLAVLAQSQRPSAEDRSAKPADRMQT